MGRFSRLGNELYSGRRSIDFVGRPWRWYAISALLLVAAVLGLALNGLNLGIEFKGGTQYTISMQPSQVTQGNADRLRDALGGSNIPAAQQPTVTTNGDRSILVTTEQMSQADNKRVIDLMARTVHVNGQRDVSPDIVGPSWGAQVAHKALQGLGVFLVLVVLFIWAYFREWKMSVAALVALGHDILITVGVYALTDFQVTPATVTGVLTILGFSLYDTVVVFDKVKENTRSLSSGRTTYAQRANLAVNQTLVRSINTSIVALLPVAAILYVGVVYLGSGALKDLALALFVGMAAGTYSSIFVATPLLAQLKSREKVITQADARARARAKRNVDRYAEVPTFSEGMAVEDDPGVEEVPSGSGAAGRPSGAGQVPPRRPEASGSGRVVPQSKAPLRSSGAAKRSQPSRQPRSKRHP